MFFKLIFHLSVFEFLKCQMDENKSKHESDYEKRKKCEEKNKTLFTNKNAKIELESSTTAIQRSNISIKSYKILIWKQSLTRTYSGPRKMQANDSSQI